jgi:hypothetical protein
MIKDNFGGGECRKSKAKYNHPTLTKIKDRNPYTNQSTISELSGSIIIFS